MNDYEDDYEYFQPTRYNCCELCGCCCDPGYGCNDPDYLGD
jgi:hypothetical protein